MHTNLPQCLTITIVFLILSPGMDLMKFHTSYIFLYPRDYPHNELAVLHIKIALRMLKAL